MLAAVELWNLDGMCTDKYVVSKQLGSTSLEIVTAFTVYVADFGYHNLYSMV